MHGMAEWARNDSAKGLGNRLFLYICVKINSLILKVRTTIAFSVSVLKMRVIIHMYIFIYSITYNFMIKRMASLLLIAGAVITTGCDKEETVVPETKKATVQVSIEEMPITRTTLTEGIESLKFTWNEDDRISLYDVSTGKKLTDCVLKSGPDKTWGEFEFVADTIPENGSDYIVVYPSSDAANYSDLNRTLEGQSFSTKAADLNNFCYLEGEYIYSENAKASIKHINTLITFSMIRPAKDYNAETEGKPVKLTFRNDDADPIELKLNQTDWTSPVTLHMVAPATGMQKSEIYLAVTTANNHVYDVTKTLYSYMPTGTNILIDFSEDEFVTEEAVSLASFAYGVPEGDTWIISDVDAYPDLFINKGMIRDQLQAIAKATPERRINLVFPNLRTLISGQIGVFSNCSAIGSVSFGEATTIGGYAFWNCENLTEVHLPKAESIEMQSFANCRKLTTVSADQLKYVSSQVFLDCSSLQTLTFPSLEKAESSAFFRASGLTTVSFPKLSSIGTQAFVDCKALTSVSFPALVDLQQYAFTNCTALESVQMDKIDRISLGAFQYCSALKSVSMTNATTIEVGAFSQCSSLNTISLPKAQEIQEQSFTYCSSLTNISFPEATIIKGGAFSYCESLKEISLPKLQEIPMQCFASCSALTNISLPEATIIKGEAFTSCKSLKEISLPKVKAVETQAFSYCSVLETVSMPEVITLNDLIFYNCPLLTSLSINKAESIGLSFLTDNKNMKELWLPNVKSIGERAFNSCESLKKVTAPVLTKAGSSSFAECNSLLIVSMDKLEQVSESMFSSCTMLQTISLPNARIIENGAFNGCSSLETLTLERAEVIEGYSFSYPCALKSFTLATKSTLQKISQGFIDNSFHSNVDFTIGAGNGTVNGKEWTFNNKTWTFNSVTTL